MPHTEHWTALEGCLCSASGKGNEVHQIVFLESELKTFQARAESAPARLRWDRVENMSREMKLTPTFFFTLLPFRAETSRLLGKVGENMLLTVEHVVTSASVSLFSSTCICCDSLFPCTTCLEYSACTSIFFARALACACTHEVSHPFHFHLLCLLSYVSLLSFFFPAVVEILDVLACLLSSPHHLWAGSRRV